MMKTRQSPQIATSLFMNTTTKNTFPFEKSGSSKNGKDDHGFERDEAIRESYVVQKPRAKDDLMRLERGPQPEKFFKKHRWARPFSMA